MRNGISINFNKTIKYLVLFICFNMIGCSGPVEVIKLDLPKQNPMSYTFNFSKAEIIKVLSEGTFKEYPKGEFSARFSKNVIPESNIPDSLSYIYKEEFFFINLNRMKFPMSRLYFSDAMAPILSYANYIVRLIPLSSSSTKVEIISIDRKLSLGETWDNQLGSTCLMGGGHHGLTLMRYEATTIEEYEILLKIGIALGVASSMPKIYYPDYTSIKFENKPSKNMYDFKPIKID